MMTYSRAAAKMREKRINLTQIIAGAVITTAVGTAALAMVNHEKKQDDKIESFQKYKEDVAGIKQEVHDVHELLLLQARRSPRHAQD